MEKFQVVVLAAGDFVERAVFDSMTRFFTQVALFASVRIEKIDEIFLLPSVIGLACQTFMLVGLNLHV